MDVGMDTDIDLRFVRDTQHELTNRMLALPLGAVAHDWLMENLEAMRTWPRHAHVVLGCMRMARQLPGNSVVSCRLLLHLLSIVWANCREIRPHREISACIKEGTLRCVTGGAVEFTEEGNKQASQLPLLDHLATTPIARTDDEPSVEPDPEFSFVRENGGFRISFPGAPPFSLPDLVGLRYIHFLLSMPFKFFFCDRLFNAFHDLRESSESALLELGETDNQGRFVQRDRDITQDLAFEGVRRKLAELCSEREDAVRYGRSVDKMKVDEEETLRKELERLRNEQQRLPEPHHRVAVTKAIQSAIERIARSNSRFSEHLDASIERGITVGYRPRTSLASKLKL